MPPKPGLRRRAGATSRRRKHRRRPHPTGRGATARSRRPAHRTPGPAREGCGGRAGPGRPEGVRAPRPAPLRGPGVRAARGDAACTPPRPGRPLARLARAQGRAPSAESSPSPAPRRAHARPPHRWERSPDPATRPGPLRPAPRARGSCWRPSGRVHHRGGPVPKLSLGRGPNGPPEGRPLPGSLGTGMRIGAGRTGRARGRPLGWPRGPCSPRLPRCSPRRALTCPAADGAGAARPGRLERGRWARVSLEGGRRGAVGAPRLLTARTLHFPLCFLFTCNRKNNRSSCRLICSPALPTSPTPTPPRLGLEGITQVCGSCACPSKQVHKHTKEMARSGPGTSPLPAPQPPSHPRRTSTAQRET